MPTRGADGFEPVVGVELVEDVLDVVANGLDADPQVPGDVVGLGALLEPAEDLDLPPGESRSIWGGGFVDGSDLISWSTGKRIRTLELIRDRLQDVDDREPVGS